SSGFPRNNICFLCGSIPSSSLKLTRRPSNLFKSTPFGRINDFLLNHTYLPTFEDLEIITFTKGWITIVRMAKYLLLIDFRPLLILPKASVPIRDRTIGERSRASTTTQADKVKWT